MHISNLSIWILLQFFVSLLTRTNAGRNIYRENSKILFLGILFPLNKLPTLPRISLYFRLISRMVHSWRVHNDITWCWDHTAMSSTCGSYENTCPALWLMSSDGMYPPSLTCLVIWKHLGIVLFSFFLIFSFILSSLFYFRIPKWRPFFWFSVYVACSSCHCIVAKY